MTFCLGWVFFFLVLRCFLFVFFAITPLTRPQFNDEARLMSYHRHLKDVVEDQMTLASIHYLRSHYQEAIDIYKALLAKSREYAALHVYVALCYYKLDYYDVSQEVLGQYMQAHKDSATAINLKACNHFRLYNGKAAEAELRALQDMASLSFEYAQDLIKHNLVVFRAGEGALQVLPSLIDVLPEARLNLVIFFLREGSVREACVGCCVCFNVSAGVWCIHRACVGAWQVRPHEGSRADDAARVHSQGRRQRRTRAGPELEGAPQDCPAVLPARRRLCVRVWSVWHGGGALCVCLCFSRA